MPSDPETGEVFDLPPAKAPSAAQQAIGDARKRAPSQAEDWAVPETFAQAVGKMINRPFLADKHRVWNQQQRAVRDGAHPDILEFERVMVRRMGKMGIPVFAHCVVRSMEQQAKEFAQGDSKAKPGQSAHNYGCAIDLVHSTRAWNLSEKEWLVIGHIGKEVIKQSGLAIVSLAWGGDWKFYDPAHWEIQDWELVKGQYPWT